jgi:DNA-directed RNA polymerase alpha subunit
VKDSIRELGLPKRVVNRLEHEGIRTVRALVKRTPYDLLHWPGFGLESYKSIHRALELRGLSLQRDPGIHAMWEWITLRDKHLARGGELRDW